MRAPFSSSVMIAMTIVALLAHSILTVILAQNQVPQASEVARIIIILLFIVGIGTYWLRSRKKQ